MDPYQKKNALSPFFNSKIQCPICGVPSTQRIIKPSFYTEQDVDVVLRPTKLKWLKKDIAEDDKKQPRLFYMRHCIFCKFTAADNNYENPIDQYDISNVRFLKKIKYLQEKSAVYKNVVTTLSHGINVLQPDYFQAIRLHMLAPFQIQFIDEIGKKDAFNIARYYLRLAWLYLDLEENEELYYKFGAKIEKFNSILKKDWKTVPKNSEEALNFARQFYNITLIKSRQIKSDLEEVKLLLLMCRISIKLEDLTNSHKYLFNAIDKARRYDKKRKDVLEQVKFDEQELRKEKKISFNQEGKKDAAQKEASKMSVDHRRMNVFIREVHNIYDDFKEEYEEKLTRRAKNMLSRINQDRKKPHELRAILINKGIDEKIAWRVVPDKQKKGLLGIFKK